MLNLLLTLFMMVKTEPKIELQKVQQPIVVEQRKETIGWIGYTQRPIDARTQTRNRYLDSVRATTTQQIPIPLWNWERTDVTWYTYNMY